jgi:HD superfamily phosphohydrolase
VHGFIGMTQLEREIVDHPAFQRLRRIKQLAWTDYVYPGTSHTRFEHSLGVMHLASSLYEAVVTTSGDTLKEVFGYTDAGLARDWQIVRLAALLHDVGHPPFSHAAEHLLPMKAPESYSLFQGMEKTTERYEHEDYSVAIIEIILKDLIEQNSCNRRNYKITTDEVTALISKRTPGGVSLFWKDIISGQLDADRMDYLLRDSLHAGVSYGRFDLDRIVSSVCAVRRPQEESAEPKIAIMKGGIYAAEALIVARYWMHKQVYFHKTRLACDHHLEKALGEILADSAGHPSETVYFPRPDSKEELDKYLEWDDYRVMGMLAIGKGGEHGQRLMTRNHYRLVCELEESDVTLADLGASIKKNDAIVEALGPLVKYVCKPNALWYKTKPASELILVDNDGKTEIGILSAHSALMKSINVGYLRFVYADKSEAPAAREKFRMILEQQSRPEAFSVKETQASKTEDAIPQVQSANSPGEGA